MIAADYLTRIAVWSRELSAREIETARAGITEKSYRPGESIFLRGDHFEYWTGLSPAWCGWERSRAAARR